MLALGGPYDSVDSRSLPTLGLQRQCSAGRFPHLAMIEVADLAKSLLPQIAACRLWYSC